MKKLLVLLSIFFSNLAFSANPSEEGKITHLQLFASPDNPETSRFILKLSGPNESSINCSPSAWSGSMATVDGRAQYATLLALYLNDKVVRVQGTEIVGEEGAAEDLCFFKKRLIRNVYAE